MESAEAFRNLILMAAIDGRMAEAELRLLAHRATEWGVTDDEFESALEDARLGRADLALPADPVEARQHLTEMLRVMAADGRMTEREKELFALACAVMQIPETEVERLIEKALAEDAGECTAE